MSESVKDMDSLNTTVNITSVTTNIMFQQLTNVVSHILKLQSLHFENYDERKKKFVEY